MSIRQSPGVAGQQAGGVVVGAFLPARCLLATCAVAWLAACAGPAGMRWAPPLAPPVAASPPGSPARSLDTCAGAVKPAPSQALSPAGDRARLSMESIAAMLRDVAALSQAQAAQRQQQLQAPGARRGPTQRVELAYLLLSRTGGNADDGAQAQELLKGLDMSTADGPSREFLHLLQRMARQDVELSLTRAELAKAQRKVADLEDKIGQIKNLEVQLQPRPPQSVPPEPGKGAAPSRP